MLHLLGRQVMLREYRESDFTAIRAWVNDQEPTQYLSPIFDRPHTEQMTRAFFDQVMGNTIQGYAFIIARREDESYLGQCDLRVGSDGSRQAELAIVIPDPENRGRGYGRQAMTILLDFGFGTVNLHKIHLKVFTRNERAIALYRSLGFVEEGILRHEVYRHGEYLDQMVMSLLEDEWRGRADQMTE